MTRQVLALAYVMGVAALFFNIQPIIVGALADGFGFNEAELGELVAVSLLSAFVVIASSWFWVLRVPVGRAVLIGMLLAFGSCILLALAGDYAGVALALGVQGVGMSLMIAPVTASIGRLADPARAYGIAITVQVGLAAVVAFVLPAFVLDRFGIQGLAGVIAVTLAGVVVCLPLLRDDVEPAGVASLGGAAGNVHAWLCLAAMAIYFLGLNGTWAFLERIGARFNHDPVAIGNAISIALVLGAMGSALASVLSRRVGDVAALALALGGFVVAIALLLAGGHYVSYLAGVLLFNIAWNFSLPFQLAILATQDGSGRFVALLPAAQTLGGSIGPALAGLLILGLGVYAIYLQLMLGALVACAVFVYVSRHRRTLVPDGLAH